jgi:hypothetical protein
MSWSYLFFFMIFFCFFNDFFQNYLGRFYFLNIELVENLAF